MVLVHGMVEIEANGMVVATVTLGFEVGGGRASGRAGGRAGGWVGG